LTAARLLPPVRSGVFLIAGTIHFSFVRFLVADLLVAGIGVGILFFSGKWLIDVIGQATHWLIYVAAAAVALYLLYRLLPLPPATGTPAAYAALPIRARGSCPQIQRGSSSYL
jgi:membrane protein DedA with SNARE-associated domain